MRVGLTKIDMWRADKRGMDERKWRRRGAAAYVAACLAIVWSALIAPEVIWAADPLTFKYTTAASVYTNDIWQLDYTKVKVSGDKKQVVGVVKSKLERGKFGVMSGGRVMVKSNDGWDGCGVLPGDRRVYAVYGHGKHSYVWCNEKPWGKGYPSVSPIWFSSDGKHLVYVARGELRFDEHVVVDEKALGLFRKIDKKTLKITGHGDGVGYRAYDGEKWRFAFNDRVDEASELVGFDVYGGGGEVVVYFGNRKGKWHVIVESAEAGRRFVSEGYLQVREPVVFSGDGEHYAVWVQKNAGLWELMVDGEVRKGYATHKPGEVVLSEDGEHVMATMVSKSRRWKLIVDGECVGAFAEVGQGTMRFTQDGKHAAAAVMDNGLWRVCLDGQLLGAATEIAAADMVFAPDMKRFAFAARGMMGNWQVSEYAMGCDGVKLVCESGLYQGVKRGTVVYSQDSKRLGYVVACGDEEAVVVDGKLLCHAEKMGRPVFSPKSQHVAAVGAMGQEMMVWVDGQQAGGPFLRMGPNAELVFQGENEIFGVVELRKNFYATMKVEIGVGATMMRRAEVGGN